MDMAISASSRIRECGTFWTEAARVGVTNLFCHCIPVQPTRRLFFTQAACGDAQHDDSRFGFGGRQIPAVSVKKDPAAAKAVRLLPSMKAGFLVVPGEALERFRNSLLSPLRLTTA